ncbi:MAG: hypothetical protein KDB48_07525 [Solirubrobacterales bacterium]|nr:hypothetical protein [Solirubrobacterales bacterium]HMT05612.1 hypothetical protein [Solirubrobacterales bacterium]
MKITLAAAACLAVFLGLTAPANSATTIVADPTCCLFQPGPLIQGLGETAQFRNAAEVTPHDVTSTEAGPDGNPLFFSEPIVGGEVTPVAGTEYLAAGSYPFFCNLHGTSMSGELVIDGSSGKAKPRPSLRAKLENQKLKTIRKRGSLKVKVTAVTAVTGATVTASKGKTKLGSKEKISLGAGKSATYSLRLTNAGRKAIRNGKSVSITIRALAPFGKPASAIRKVK